MVVTLCRSEECQKIFDYKAWYSITGTTVQLDSQRKVSNLAELLEREFTAVRDTWWRIGKMLGQSVSGKLAHTPTCASYKGDFGLMVAWYKLTEKFALEQEIYLVVCDDPWVFRQLAKIKGVLAGTPPLIWPKVLIYFLRGYAARLKLAIKLLVCVLLFRWNRKKLRTGVKSLIVYGHPKSNREGFDAYFGDLMVKMDSLQRVLHTDGRIFLASKILSDKTVSLHAWGNIFYSFIVVFKVWRLKKMDLELGYSWLVKRAATIENATASIATNAWQHDCQKRWLSYNRPTHILWPWENHPWERQLCRDAKALGIKTIGYQHAVIGPQQFNPAPGSNPDGFSSIPDTIICSGPAYLNQLKDWGMPSKKLVVGGAFRIIKIETDIFDPAGPVFVATSSNTEITKMMMEAVNLAKQPGRKFLIKIHPLYPKDIKETDDTEITSLTLPEQKSISAVFYGTGTSGLEGLLANLPTYRLQPDNQIAVNVLPVGVDAIPVSLRNLGASLNSVDRPKNLVWENIYSKVDYGIWKKELGEN